MADAVQMTPKVTPTATINIELWYAYAKMNRWIIEVNRCNSANGNNVYAPDLIRWKTYVSEWRAMIGMIAKIGDMDVPKTGSVFLQLRPPPQIQYVENDQVNLFVQWLEVARDELLNSESSRRISGMAEPDVKRQAEYWTHAEEIIAYIEATQPRDLTESAPREAAVDPSLTGVNPGAEAVYNQRLGYPAGPAAK